MNSLNTALVVYTISLLLIGLGFSLLKNKWIASHLTPETPPIRRGFVALLVVAPMMGGTVLLFGKTILLLVRGF